MRPLPAPVIARRSEPAPPPNDALERAWADGVRAGNKTDFECLYRTYYRRLVGFAYTYVHVEPIAEELVQDLFLAIWRDRERWELHTTVRAYLFQATRNSAINHLRHQGVSRTALDDAAVEGRMLAMSERPAALDAQHEADELARAAVSAIGKLPPRCRMAFTLCRGHGLTYAEAAQVMGISERTVKIQMSRALLALRTGLARWLS